MFRFEFEEKASGKRVLSITRRSGHYVGTIEYHTSAKGYLFQANPRARLSVDDLQAIAGQIRRLDHQLVLDRECRKLKSRSSR